MTNLEKSPKRKKVLYIGDKENDFFKRNEYSYIGFDFKYEALESISTPELVEKIKEIVSIDHIKRFSYEEGERHYFFNFYVANSIDTHTFTIINAYYNKDSYFSVDYIRNYTLKDLGLVANISSIKD